MKKNFKEYHLPSDEEFEQLWKTGLFVFDANTLLNMYRYSRDTVESYLSVLSELKKSKQIWIPHQVGYEFYENRVAVIQEYEKSYDEILSLLEKSKSDIEEKYKDHPFLNLTQIKSEMTRALSAIETKIKSAKTRHPKWLENDDVLEKINDLFDGCVGPEYTQERLLEIYKEGAIRYDKHVPPGFKDDKKPGDEKFGDLVLWNQIIDHAKSTKKSIIFISGDVKEDWWLVKNGKRIMPLPQLKKEIFQKAKVNFHIYTADRFLEYYQKSGRNIDSSAITEVRKIRELEEKKMMNHRKSISRNLHNHHLHQHSLTRYQFECRIILGQLSDLVSEIGMYDSDKSLSDRLQYIHSWANEFRAKLEDRGFDEIYTSRFYRLSQEAIGVLEDALHNIAFKNGEEDKIRRFIIRLDLFTREISRRI